MQRLRASLAPYHPRRVKAEHIPRLAGYVVMAFIAWLLLALLFRPWMSSTATRAILDAPAMLVTSPIDGTVSAINTAGGDGLKAGDTVAVVTNTVVNRENLTALLTRRLDLENASVVLAGKISSNASMLAYIDSEYGKYRSAATVQAADALASAQARERAAQAQIDALNTRYQRDVALEHDGAISHDTVVVTQSQLQSAQIAKSVVVLDSKRAMTNHSAAQQGIWLADSGTNLLADLAQRQVDLRAEIEQERVQKTALDSQLREFDKLVEMETHRVDQLSSYTIKAYGDGVAQEVVTPIGTHVSAGATLVRATDCEQSNVVSVFPSRIDARLTIGSQLDVVVKGVNGTLHAKVTQLLPKAPDATQNDFSVPFPYAEDGSVYAIAHWDASVPKSVIAQTCSPGRSVEVRVH